MPIILHRAPIQCLVSVRGHPFDRTAFDRVFQGMEGVAATMVDQPAAAILMNPKSMARFDALVLYDMPGLDFSGAAPRPAFIEPDDRLREDFAALLDQGKGVVALHHALAGWPTWDEYGEWLGGRFLYRRSRVRGEMRLDSGYAHDVAQTFSVAGDHPVTKGLPATFAMHDEPYLAEIFEDSVTPILRSDAVFTRERFYSAAAALDGRMYANEGWAHPPGSNIAGWTKRAVNSPLVYLQPGDGPSAYDNPHYRRLVENAVRWVAATRY